MNNKINFNIEEILLNDLELHELSYEHPKMTEIEYNRLKQSIDELGQQDEILVYRNKIVDGRHRFWVMENLKKETIRCKVLDYNLAIEDVKEIVFGTEVRRHQTPVQKAIKAWRATQKDGLTQREAASKFMTSKTMISKCKFISEHKGEKMLDDLYNQEPVTIGDRSTTSIDTLKKFIEMELESNMNAKFKKNINPDYAIKCSELYLQPLRDEPLDVIKYVAKGAYSIFKEKS